MSKNNHLALETVRTCVAKLNRERDKMRDLERQLKPYIDAKRRVADYFKHNPGVCTIFDIEDEHYCTAVRNKQTRFNPTAARERLGPDASLCYEEKTIVGVSLGVDQDAIDSEELNDMS